MPMMKGVVGRIELENNVEDDVIMWLKILMLEQF